MRDEHNVSIQSSMQLLPTRGPVVVLQRLQEQFPEWSKIMLCAVCCVLTKELRHLMLRISMAESTKCFLGILCYITFSVVSDFKGDFLYLYCECNL